MCVWPCVCARYWMLHPRVCLFVFLLLMRHLQEREGSLGKSGGPNWNPENKASADERTWALPLSASPYTATTLVSYYAPGLHIFHLTRELFCLTYCFYSGFAVRRLSFLLVWLSHPLCLSVPSPSVCKCSMWTSNRLNDHWGCLVL